MLSSPASTVDADLEKVLPKILKKSSNSSRSAIKAKDTNKSKTSEKSKKLKNNPMATPLPSKTRKSSKKSSCDAFWSAGPSFNVDDVHSWAASQISALSNSAPHPGPVSRAKTTLLVEKKSKKGAKKADADKVKESRVLPKSLLLLLDENDSMKTEEQVTKAKQPRKSTVRKSKKSSFDDDENGGNAKVGQNFSATMHSSLLALSAAAAEAMDEVDDLIAKNGEMPRPNRMQSTNKTSITKSNKNTSLFEEVNVKVETPQNGK
jgi:hypothetical protein